MSDDDLWGMLLLDPVTGKPIISVHKWYETYERNRLGLAVWLGVLSTMVLGTMLGVLVLLGRVRRLEQNNKPKKTD